MPGRPPFALGALAVALFAPPSSASPLSARTDFRRPIAFEANDGQADPSVRFLARAAGYTFFLTADAAVLAHGSDAVRMSFRGAQRDARIVPIDRLPGGTNYLLGRDASRWRTGVASYAKVRYEALYPGIDLVFYANDRELEYDLVVRPGADPGSIRLVLDGTGKLEIVGGDLVAHTRKGQVRFRKPTVHQAAVEGRPARVIEGGYRLLRGRTVAFDVGAYDRTRPLVIDPVVVYATYLGGSGGDIPSGGFAGGTQMIAVDANGSAYVAGTTDSSNFPTTAGALRPTASSSRSATEDGLQPCVVPGPFGPGLGTNAFVAKLSPDGSSLVYATYLGGTFTIDDRHCSGPRDFGAAITVDPSGNAYVTGVSGSVDFPTTVSTPKNLFVAKLDPTGSSLVYSRRFGGETASGIAVDGAGNAYVAGMARGGDEDLPTLGAYQTVCHCNPAIGGVGDAFVMKFNATATQVLYGTFLGGGSHEAATAIAVNGAGEAYVTGRTSSTDFPTVAPAQAAFAGGLTDVFVTKLSADGAAALFSTYLGGSDTESRDLANAIAVDVAGNAYVAGYTVSSDFPTTPGAFQPTFLGGGPGSKHAFVTKYSPGGTVAYSTYLGALGSQFPEDVATSIAADALGRAYVVGSTSSHDFPKVDPTQPMLACGASCSQDAFLSVLDASGSSLEFSTYIGGTSFDQAQGVALGPLGSVYVMGGTLGDFPTQGALQPAHGGQTDLFVTRIDVGVVDTTAPEIGDVADVVVEATSCPTTPVTFTLPSVSDDTDPQPTLSATPASGDAFPLGATTVTLTATDASGNSSTKTFNVTVRDTTAPLITSSAADPAVLSPPNHELVPVTVSVSAVDLCDASLACSIVAVSSDEPVSGHGAGHTSPDWEITGPLTLQLRAERAAHGDGRLYVVTLECMDDSGNRARKDVSVSVPHRSGHEHDATGEPR